MGRGGSGDRTAVLGMVTTGPDLYFVVDLILQGRNAAVDVGHATSCSLANEPDPVEGVTCDCGIDALDDRLSRLVQRIEQGTASPLDIAAELDVTIDTARSLAHALYCAADIGLDECDCELSEARKHLEQARDLARGLAPAPAA